MTDLHACCLQVRPLLDVQLHKRGDAAEVVPQRLLCVRLRPRAAVASGQALASGADVGKSLLCWKCASQGSQTGDDLRLRRLKKQPHELRPTMMMRLFCHWVRAQRAEITSQTCASSAT